MKENNKLIKSPETASPPPIIPKEQRKFAIPSKSYAQCSVDMIAPARRGIVHSEKIKKSRDTEAFHEHF
jgi:hypothetical protein